MLEAAGEGKRSNGRPANRGHNSGGIRTEGSKEHGRTVAQEGSLPSPSGQHWGRKMLDGLGQQTPGETRNGHIRKHLFSAKLPPAQGWTAVSSMCSGMSYKCYQASLLLNRQKGGGHRSMNDSSPERGVLACANFKDNEKLNSKYRNLQEATY